MQQQQQKKKALPKVRAAVAPEPKDIYWENLELDGSTYQFERRLVTQLITGFTIVVGLGLSVAAKVVDAVYGDEMADQTDTWSTAKTFGVSILAAATVSVTNLVLKKLIPNLAYREGYSTWASYESAVFTKLSLAYVINTSVLPLLVGVLPLGITQAWYEDGGVVTQAMMLMLASGFTPPLEQALQPLALFNRHVRSHFAVSQQKLDELWRPPELKSSLLYASLLKTLSLCLIYAPLWPMAYLVTSLLCAFAMLCYRVAISAWYRQPPPLSDLLTRRMEAGLAALLLLHVVITHFATLLASPQGDYFENALQCGGMACAYVQLLVALMLWLLGVIVLRVPRSGGGGPRELNTDGVRLKDVAAHTGGQACERYECPAAVNARRLRRLEKQGVNLMQELVASRVPGDESASQIASSTTAAALVPAAPVAPPRLPGMRTARVQPA